jgi:hypothetical protein
MSESVRPPHYAQYLEWREALENEVARLLKGMGSKEAMMASRLVSYAFEAKTKVLAIAKFDRGDAARELLGLLFEIHSDPYPSDNWQTDVMEKALSEAAAFGNAEMFAHLLDMTKRAFFGDRHRIQASLTMCLPMITTCNASAIAVRMLASCIAYLEDRSSALRQLTSRQLWCAWRDAVDAGQIEVVRILYAPMFERFDRRPFVSALVQASEGEEDSAAVLEFLFDNATDREVLETIDKIAQGGDVCGSRGRLEKMLETRRSL